MSPPPEIWFSWTPAFAQTGKPTLVHATAREPLAHVGIQVTGPCTCRTELCSCHTLPERDVPTQYLHHEPISGSSSWTWTTDPIPAPGLYWVTFTLAGVDIAKSGFWTEGYFTDPSPPPPPPPQPSPSGFPLRGIHDRAGADWLKKRKLQGWCLIPVYVDVNPHAVLTKTEAQFNAFKVLDLQQYAQAGIRILVNLRYSYATDDGGQGTMPPPDRLFRFENACIQTMHNNPEAWAYVYCNEFNNDREHPAGFRLTPDYYKDSYNRMWAAKPKSARLMPGAIDPYNPGWGDWRLTWKHVLDRIEGCDGLALHAYTHTSDLNRIRSIEEFSHAPLLGVYYDLRVLESQQAIIPERFRDKPQIITETNHWVRRDGKVGWDQETGEWVKQAYAYFAERGVIGVCLFRYNHDDWRFSDLPQVLDALEKQNASST